MIRWICYLALSFGLLFFYISGLDRQGFWEDEIYTARDIGILDIHDREPEFRLSFTELTYKNNNHPPLYFWLIEKWTRLFGFSEWTSRLFSVLIFALVLIVAAWAAREWAPGHPTAPLWTVLILGTSSFLVSLAREARMYPLALFWIILSLVLFTRLNKTPSDPSRADEPAAGKPPDGARGPVWALAAVNALGLYTHYYFAFLLAAEWAVAGLYLWRRRMALRSFAFLFVPVLFFLPWIPQLSRQYEAKTGENLWVRGPQDSEQFFSALGQGGATALVKLLFGSDFQALILLGLTLAAALLYALLQKTVDTGTRNVGLLVTLTAIAYALLIGSDLYHHTLTLTRTKYLFFAVIPLLMGYILIGLGNLSPVRYTLLLLVLTYNVSAIVRDHHYAGHPDWRAIARQAEVLMRHEPIIVADIDFWRCLAFYLPAENQLLNEEFVSVYPERFWYLAPYLRWNSNMQERVVDLAGRFTEIDRINIDRFSCFIRYSIRER